MSKKPTLAYIDHIAHKENGSNMFLKELLSEYFTVTSFWVNPWEAPRVIPVEEINKFDYVLFFQRTNPFSELIKIRSKILWVAVYDSLTDDHYYWKALSTLPIKIISFSKKVHDKCGKYGIESIYAKYYPDPSALTECIPHTEQKKILFWHRSTVSFEDVKNILYPNEFDSLTYRSAPDHDYKPEVLDSKDIQDYKVTFDNRPFSNTTNILKEMLTEHPIFIEPRLMEGIGMAYLEAMASGHCVIANNDATLNEYITDGVNGIIVDYDNPKKISLANWKTLGENALKSSIAGRKEWEQSKEKLAESVKVEASPAITNTFSILLWRSIYAVKHQFFETKQGFIRRAKIKAKKKLAQAKS